MGIRYNIPTSIREVTNKFQQDSQARYLIQFLDVEMDFIIAALKFFQPYQGQVVSDAARIIKEFMTFYFEVYYPYETADIFFRFNTPEEVVGVLRKLIL